MTPHLPLHVVDPDSRTRAQLVRLAFAAGERARGYDDLDSLIDCAPREGIAIVSPGLLDHRCGTPLDRMDRAGLFLPLVLALHEPDVAQVVEAIRGGMFDVLCLPCDHAGFARMLSHARSDAPRHQAARRRQVEARHRIAGLTRRERQVLDWLSEGRSNKAIARELAISPRTVEVHRANMMDKLGATHSAEAVRLRLDAALAGPEDAACADGAWAVNSIPLFAQRQ